MADTTPPVREALVAELTQLLQQQAAGALRDIAARLVDSSPATLFGQNEFAIRDILLSLGATAYNTHLAQKKTAMTAAASPAPTPPAATSATTTASLTTPTTLTPGKPAPASTATAADVPSASSASSTATGPITTAAAAATASRRGTNRSASRRPT